MRSNHKLEPVVKALQALDCHFNTVDVLAVGQILTTHGVTVAEFIHLDEHPGTWGHDPAGLGAWHHKLRRFRNSPAVRSYRFTKEDGS